MRKTIITNHQYQEAIKAIEHTNANPRHGDVRHVAIPLEVSVTMESVDLLAVPNTEIAFEYDCRDKPHWKAINELIIKG